MPDWIARLPRPLGFVERNPVFPIHIVVRQHAMVGDKLNGQYLELICCACSRRHHADRRALARLNRIVSRSGPGNRPYAARLTSFTSYTYGTKPTIGALYRQTPAARKRLGPRLAGVRVSAAAHQGLATASARQDKALVALK
jgi:hypothetical protein